jgi:hypothetical protein
MEFPEKISTWQSDQHEMHTSMRMFSAGHHNKMAASIRTKQTGKL